MEGVLVVVALLGSGMTAGVFLAVAVSVGPTLLAMPVDQYRQLHDRLGEGYHPTMPILVTATLVADVGLVVLVSEAAARALLGLAAIMIVGVQAVSHLGNAPLNKRVRDREASVVEEGWEALRQRWWRWHLTRTALGAAVLALNSVVIVVAA